MFLKTPLHWTSRMDLKAPDVWEKQAKLGNFGRWTPFAVDDGWENCSEEGSCFKSQWIGLRENLQGNHSFFPGNIGGQGVNFTSNQPIFPKGWRYVLFEHLPCMEGIPLVMCDYFSCRMCFSFAFRW